MPLPAGKSLKPPCARLARRAHLARSQKLRQRRRSLRPCLTYVTRSPGSASSYRSLFPPFGSGAGSFVRITVTGLARASHPVPTAAARRRFRAETYGIEFPTFYPLLCELSTDFPHLRGFGCMIFPWCGRSGGFYAGFSVYIRILFISSAPSLRLFLPVSARFFPVLCTLSAFVDVLPGRVGVFFLHPLLTICISCV